LELAADLLRWRVDVGLGGTPLAHIDDKFSKGYSTGANPVQASSQAMTRAFSDLFEACNAQDLCLSAFREGAMSGKFDTSMDVAAAPLSSPASIACRFEFTICEPAR
jgi:hypothetical protein